MHRRRALRNLTGTALSLSAIPSFAQLMKDNDPTAPREAAVAALKGNINHSVCRWCYDKIKLEDLCQAAKSIGIKSIELVGPEEWPILKKYGLTSALPWGAGKGIN
ncbi:MAG: hydroxypyruvate isomerase, partial [Cytophagaceae bacterium]